MDVSIVIPLLNEEESLQELYDWITRVVKANGLSCEIIFVDDGSRDHSWEVIEGIGKTDPNVKGIRFRRNYGKAAALNVGFQAATGDVVITMDADLQDSPDEIPELVQDDQGGWLRPGFRMEEKTADPISKTIPTRFTTGPPAGCRASGCMISTAG